MKIPAKDVESFLINMPKNIRSILLYGPDAGLVKTRADNFANKYNLVAKFRYDEIKNNPAILSDSLRSRSLFDKTTSKPALVMITFSGAIISEALTQFIKVGSYQGLLLFTAGDLAPDSGLRKFFDKTPDIASIPCYVDDQASIARIIQQRFKQNQITCEAGLVSLLINYIAVGNHALVLSEIEKILLFLGDKKHIIASDIKEFLELQGEITFDKLCYQLSLRQINDIEPLLVKLQSEGNNLVTIIRTIIRHFTRLYQVLLQIKQGKTEQYALETLHPAVFFKQRSDFSRSLKLWNIEEILTLLKQLNEAELMAKQKPNLADLLLKKIIYSLLQK